MKDRQVEQPGQQSRIPIVSSLVHCMAMTVIVYFRSAFGFVYLRPKSVFFAFSWAFVLFTIYAWCEPLVWAKYRDVCIFGSGAVVLYWLHLSRAVFQQFRGSGKHDHYSGSSHLHSLLKLFGVADTPRVEMFFHVWVEPVLTLVAAGTLRFGSGEMRLSLWLACAAGAMWLKEVINHWFRIRQRKRQQDIFDDAGETVEPESGIPAVPIKATRKARIKRGRADEPD